MTLRPNEVPLGIAQDLSQEKFGLIQPLYRITNAPGGTRWHCKCDCGNEFDAYATNLKRGRTQSCGCARSTKADQRMIGQRFGKLIVERRSDRKEVGRVFWICKCDCGNLCTVRGDQLTQGVTSSCGCLKDLAGQKFGELTVIRSLGAAESNGMKIWECQCSCGNVVQVRTGNLQTGHVTSCGCKSHISRGEEKISKLLRDANISFEKQKIFKSCRFPETGYPAKFDFYVNNEYLIEYDGSQHYFARDSGWNNKENYEMTRAHDRIKNEWAKQNHIPLIRIPYTRYDSLDLQDLLLESSEFIVEGEES